MRVDVGQVGGVDNSIQALDIGWDGSGVGGVCKVVELNQNSGGRAWQRNG